MKKKKSKSKGERNSVTVHVSNRMQMFFNGEIKIEDLDDEEIRRGQFRSLDGDFKGRPSDMIPREFYNAVVRETIRRANNRFREEIEPAIETLHEIMENPRAPSDSRMKSAIYLIERVAGKVPEKNEVSIEVAKWEQDIDGLIIE